MGVSVLVLGRSGSGKSTSLRAYVIDDANYLMAFQNFAKAKESGFSKFTDMAVSFERLLEYANATNGDTITYFLMHPEYDDSGRMRAKTIGKMLDNQLCVEGMFPIVLMAECDESGYHLVVKNDGSTCVKAPMGMFSEAVIDNDLKAVDAAIREYWGMAPITDERETSNA